MAGHDLGMSVIDARQPAGHLRDVLVARTVKSVAAHAVLVVIPVGKRVHEVLGRHRLVERGVEHGDLRGIGQNVLHGQNTFQVGRIVQRGQFETCLDLLLDGLIHHRAVLKVLAAVGHPVADRRDFGNAFQHAVLRIDERVENQADSGSMVGNALHDFILGLSGRLMGQYRVRKTDSLDDSLHEQRIIVGALHVDHLILDRRAAAIQNKDFHRFI